MSGFTNYMTLTQNKIAKSIAKTLRYAGYNATANSTNIVSVVGVPDAELNEVKKHIESMYNKFGGLIINVQS
jgi:hypothetical protein